jgi:hypothetical protein
MMKDTGKPREELLKWAGTENELKRVRGGLLCMRVLLCAVSLPALRVLPPCACRVPALPVPAADAFPKALYFF